MRRACELGAGAEVEKNLSFTMRQKQRSLAQSKHTEMVSHWCACSHPDDALIDARADNREISRLAKLDAAKRKIRSTQKREQRALQKTKLMTTKVKELQAQKRHGAPVVDIINNESDLRRCEGREMTLLIYLFQHDI